METRKPGLFPTGIGIAMMREGMCGVPWRRANGPLVAGSWSKGRRTQPGSAGGRGDGRGPDSGH